MDNKDKIRDDLLEFIESNQNDYKFHSGTNNSLYIEDISSKTVFSININEEYKLFHDLIGPGTFIELFKHIDSGKYATYPNEIFNVRSIEEHGDDIHYVKFNPSNWNSGQDLLRYFIEEINGKSIYDEALKSINFKIIYKKSGNFCTSILIDDYNNSDLYTIFWREDLPCTRDISYNGETISLSKYIDLINNLSSEPTLRNVFKKILKNRGIKCDE